jgi:DNA-damage-inducible protein J
MYEHKRKVIKMTTTNYNIRLDQDLKDRSFSVLQSYGLTPSQAIRLFLNQVADTNAVPLSFDYQPKLNAQTIAAIAEIASGEGTKYDNFDDFMGELEGEVNEIH